MSRIQYSKRLSELRVLLPVCKWNMEHYLNWIVNTIDGNSVDAVHVVQAFYMHSKLAIRESGHLKWHCNHI